MTAYFLPLTTLVFAHLLAAISPGPAFVFVAKTSVGDSRRSGLIAALAMGAGACLWALAALLGLAGFFAKFSVLYVIVKVLGGLFLGWTALQIWRHAAQPLLQGATDNLPANIAPNIPNESSTFATALKLQLSNPKAAIFFGSIFVAILPQHIPLWIKLVLPAVIFFNEAAWFAVVATVLSTPRARVVYGRLKVFIDRGVALFLGFVAMKIILR